MCEEALYFNCASKFSNLITYDEYLPLKHVYEGINLEEEKDFYHALAKRMLCVYDIQNSKFVILDEFNYVIGYHLDHLDLQALKEQQSQDEIIVGIIKTYGMLSFYEFNQCLKHYLPTSNLTANILEEITYYVSFFDTVAHTSDQFMIDARLEEYEDLLIKAYGANADFFPSPNYLPKSRLVNIEKKRYRYS